jgi:hypothetical protein
MPRLCREDGDPARSEVRLEREAMMQMESIWTRIRNALRGRYVRAIEDELARERAETARLRDEMSALRAENRAMVNSLLGTAGLPPIEPAGAAQLMPTGPAVRRRSWPQIAITRELDAARKAAVREKHTVSPRAS